MKRKLLFTGGHHNSAIATIDYLISNKMLLREDVIWLGKKYNSNLTNILEQIMNIPDNSNDETPEYIEVTDRKIKFYNLVSGKFYRIHNYKYLPQFIYNLILIPYGFLNAMVVILKEQPKLVVSFGGYQALPTVLMASIFGIKSVTHEQTVTIGLANRIIQRFVSRIYTAWPKSNYNINNEKKIKYVGLPLRENIFCVKQIKKNDVLFNKKQKTLYVTGGKSGAKLLNEFVLNNLKNLLSSHNIILQTGNKKKDYQSAITMRSGLDEKYKKKFMVRSYIHEEEIGWVFKNADILVTRAGAHTIYEICALLKPAVIIPLQYVSADEQNRNAELARDFVLCQIIKEDNPDGKVILAQLNKLLSRLGTNNKKFAVDKKPLKLDGDKTLAVELMNMVRR